MAVSRTDLNREEVARLGEEVFDRVVRPKVCSEDANRFLAIDVETGDFEVADDDYSAVMRLRSRNPDGEIWLRRVGSKNAHRIGPR